jgi:biopolymer transport protein TolQ
MLLQSGSAIPSTPVELVLSATRVTQGVLVLLAILSLISWGVMLAKWREFRAMRRAAGMFLSDFEKATRLDQAASFAKRAHPSPYTRVFARATRFLLDTRPNVTEGSDERAPLSAAQVEALRLVLDSETNAERDLLGRYIPALAMIGSVSPLMGLLGTVLGVIQAFIGIATKLNRFDGELDGFGSEVIALMAREGRI